MTTYTMTGSVRGNCGHKHRTISGAAACSVRDQRDCQSVGGYSDRRIDWPDWCKAGIEIELRGNLRKAA